MDAHTYRVGVAHSVRENSTVGWSTVTTDHNKSSERAGPSTISGILASGHDDAPAIVALNRPALTYEGLRTHVEQTVATLNRFGIGCEDRVAVVLPNGPKWQQHLFRLPQVLL